MAHSVLLTGLTPDTMYHYGVMSTNVSGMMASSSDQTFITTNTASSTPGGTDTTTLQNEINAIKAEILQLQQELQNLGGSGNGGGTGTTTPSGTPTIDQNSQTVSMGGTLNFGGRNFAHEENVTVTLNGAVVATAHADGGGNFSTGSVQAPMTAGTYTYEFSGATGDTARAGVTVY